MPLEDALNLCRKPSNPYLSQMLLLLHREQHLIAACSTSDSGETFWVAFYIFALLACCARIARVFTLQSKLVLIQLNRSFGYDNNWNKCWNRTPNPLLELSYGNLRDLHAGPQFYDD